MNTRLGISRIGNGPPLVIVDGAFCSRNFGPSKALAEALSPDFTVTTYDRRGRGESEDTPAPINAEVDDLKSVTPPGAVLLGVSSGAALILESLSRGLEARAVCLYEPPYVSDAERKRPADELQRELEALVARGQRREAAQFFLRDVIGVPSLVVTLMPWLMRSTWKQNEAVAHTLPRDLALTSRPIPSNVTTRALVLGGSKSPKSLRDAVERTARALPNGTSRFIEGATHEVPAAAVARELKAFL